MGPVKSHDDFCKGEPPYHYGTGEACGSCGIQCADSGSAAGEFWGRGYGCGDAPEGAGSGTVLGTGLGYGWGAKELFVLIKARPDW